MPNYQSNFVKEINMLIRFYRKLNFKYLFAVLIIGISIVFIVLNYFSYELELRKVYSIKEMDKTIRSFDGYIEPKIPGKSENQKTVSGVDSNNNGLRDDVEIWINRSQNNPNIRNALRQVHFAYQKIMNLDLKPLGNKVDILKVNQGFQEMSDAQSCLLQFFSSFKGFQDLYKDLANIQGKSRENASQYVQAANHVSVPIEVRGDLSNDQKKLKYCKFNIEKKYE